MMISHDLNPFSSFLLLVFVRVIGHRTPLRNLHATPAMNSLQILFNSKLNPGPIETTCDVI